MQEVQDGEPWPPLPRPPGPQHLQQAPPTSSSFGWAPWHPVAQQPWVVPPPPPWPGAQRKPREGAQ
eukprot:9359429-Pyramimonas_sp.AAC.1